MLNFHICYHEILIDVSSIGFSFLSYNSAILART